MKLSVLNNLMNINKTGRIIGDYSLDNVYLYSEKMLGNIVGCLGFKKVGRYYICNTALKGDIRKIVYNKRKIVCIVSKNIEDKKYNEVTYISKNIKLEDIKKSISELVDFIDT